MVREYIDNDGSYALSEYADLGKHNAAQFEVAQKEASERPWYLATVYTSYPLGLYEAFEAAAEMEAFLTLNNIFVYCPIVHGHPTHKYMDKRLATDYDFWLTIDEKWLKICKGLIVTKMVNWETSRGITHEIKFTANLKKPILYTNFLEMPKELCQQNKE